MNKWNFDEQQVREMHAGGATDKEMALHYGVPRAIMASYRANRLRLPANMEKLRLENKVCDVCNKPFAIAQIQRHRRERHGVTSSTRGPVRRTALSLLKPKNERFDSRAAIERLLEFRRAA